MGAIKVTTSSFEAKVISILLKAGYKFEREKTFPDLKNGYYRFDFYLPSLEILIEVDGRQHFEYTPHFHKKKTDFTKAQERDRRKNSFALSHKIKLYRIPFWEIKEIERFEDIINEKFLVKSKFHNDELWRTYKKCINH